MNKIPFDIKYRFDVESGIYQVVTRDNKPVRIVCWDMNYKYPIIGIVRDEDDTELEHSYTTDGKIIDGILEYDSDLFLVDTRERELTSFEYGMLRYLQEAANMTDDSDIIKCTQKYSKELLKLC